jgi:hypothetical protein
MIRCRLEVLDRAEEKKSQESHELPFIAPRRLAFDDLCRRDEHLWRGLERSEDLRKIAERAQRELRIGEFERFVGWICAHRGVGLARAAGLPIAPPRLELAS